MTRLRAALDADMTIGLAKGGVLALLQSLCETVYVPPANVVTLLILGFCSVEVNPFGPLHEYVPPPLDVRFSEVPEQTGLLLDADAVGRLLTVALVVAVAVHPPALVTVTV